MKLDIQKFASGTIVFDNWSSGSQIRGKIEWTSTPISGQNKSSVYGEIYVRRTSSSTKGRTWNGYLEIGGNVHNFSEIYTHTSTTVGTSWVLLEYFTDTITHNTDGTKSIYIGGEVYGPSGTTLAGKSSWGGSYVNLDRLHASPVLNSVSFTEQNQILLNLGVSNNQFVPYLSQKNVSLNMTLSNNATLSSINWRFKDIELNTLVSTPILSASETPPSDTGTFTYTKLVDLTNTNIPYTEVSGQYFTKVGYSIIDNLTASFITSDSNMEQFEVIPYKKPLLNNTSTTAKRDGQTSGKVNLNINGTFFNGTFGNTQNNIQVYYKFWEKTASEPSTYIQIPSASITISNNNFSVSSYAIGSTSTSASNYFDYQKSYYVAVKVVDTIGTEATINDLSIPVGEATWSEYPDHVDFKKITIKGVEVKVPCDLITYRDIQFTKNNISSKSAVYQETSVPSVSGYTCIGVDVLSLSGGSSGYCLVSSGINGDNTIWNGAGSSASPTVKLRYIYLKNS